MWCPSIHIFNRLHSTTMALWLIYTVPNWPFQMCPTAQWEWRKFTARNQKYATLWNMGFFMAWFELHIRNCGAAQWLFTIWGWGKAVQRPSGAIFHSPINCSHRWLKALQLAATAGPAGHILEKEMDFSEKRNLRTCRHEDFPWEFIEKTISKPSPSSSNLLLFMENPRIL